MYPVQRTLYDLTNNDAADYVTDVEQIITGHINGTQRTLLLRNKVLMHQIITSLVATPRILRVYIDGKPDPAYQEPLAGALFLKPLDKYRGIGIRSCDAADFPSIIDAALKAQPSLFVAEGVDQHEVLQTISPFSVNTIKVVTIREPNTRAIFPIAATLRVGTKASVPVDNWTQGGVGFGVDMQTGRITAGVTKKEPSRRIRHHPDTGFEIADQTIPFIGDIVAKAVWLHSRLPFLNWAGWDMSMKPSGEPQLIEANPYVDLDFIQAFQPVLRDARVRAFFQHHGVI